MKGGPWTRSIFWWTRSMDPVHGGGPWTRGPCFVLSHFRQEVSDMWTVSLKCLETRTRVLTYYKEHSKESTRCKTEHSDAKPKCKLHCILKANDFIENSICIILFKTWFTCLDKEIFLFLIWIIILLFYFLIMINIPYSKALEKNWFQFHVEVWCFQPKAAVWKQSL